MKLKSGLPLSLLAGFAFSIAAYGALAADTPTSNLESQVKISKMQARQIALDRSPEGTIKNERLEQQGDRRVWVVNIAKYHEASDVTTVMVDADTGAVESGTSHAPAKK